ALPDARLHRARAPVLPVAPPQPRALRRALGGQGGGAEGAGAALAPRPELDRHRGDDRGDGRDAGPARRRRAGRRGGPPRRRRAAVGVALPGLRRRPRRRPARPGPRRAARPSVLTSEVTMSRHTVGVLAGAALLALLAAPPAARADQGDAE